MYLVSGIKCLNYTNGETGDNALSRPTQAAKGKIKETNAIKLSLAMNPEWNIYDKYEQFSSYFYSFPSSFYQKLTYVFKRVLGWKIEIYCLTVRKCHKTKMYSNLDKYYLTRYPVRYFYEF